MGNSRIIRVPELQLGDKVYIITEAEALEFLKMKQKNE